MELEEYHIHLFIYFFLFVDDKVKLWSLCYHENVFHLWREDVLTIKPEFKDKEEFLKQAIPFYWSFKVHRYQAVPKICWSLLSFLLL